MKKIALFACALSLVATQGFGQGTPPQTGLPPGGGLPVGVAENFILFGPIVGLVGAFGALAGNGSAPSTPTTPTTN